MSSDKCYDEHAKGWICSYSLNYFFLFTGNCFNLSVVVTFILLQKFNNNELHKYIVICTFPLARNTNYYTHTLTPKNKGEKAVK